MMTAIVAILIGTVVFLLVELKRVRLQVKVLQSINTYLNAELDKKYQGSKKVRQ